MFANQLGKATWLGWLGYWQFVGSNRLYQAVTEEFQRKTTSHDVCERVLEAEHKKGTGRTRSRTYSR